MLDTISKQSSHLTQPVEWIASALALHQDAMQGFFAAYAQEWEELAVMVHARLKAGKKILFCGNGGSACDAMHIAGEFVGRFAAERSGMAALALSADAGILTAVGNDYGFDSVFSRQVEALGGEEDVLIAMSTSGNSANILKALEVAQEKGVTRVLLTGEKGRGRGAYADHVFAVPVYDTARIQEVHMFALHLLAGRVEALWVADTMREGG